MTLLTQVRVHRDRMTRSVKAEEFVLALGAKLDADRTQPIESSTDVFFQVFDEEKLKDCLYL